MCFWLVTKDELTGLIRFTLSSIKLSLGYLTLRKDKDTVCRAWLISLFGSHKSNEEEDYMTWAVCDKEPVLRTDDSRTYESCI